MTNTTAPAKTLSRYTVGQAVEVLITDFSTPGYPEVWTAGVVRDVVPNGRLFDLGISIPSQICRDGSALVQRELVNARGANRKVRPA